MKQIIFTILMAVVILYNVPGGLPIQSCSLNQISRFKSERVDVESTITLTATDILNGTWHIQIDPR